MLESLKHGTSVVRLLLKLHHNHYLPSPKQQGTNFQIKKLHLAVGIHNFPRVYGQGLPWEQLATEPSLMGTAGIAGPLLWENASRATSPRTQLLPAQQ